MFIYIQLSCCGRFGACCCTIWNWSTEHPPQFPSNQSDFIHAHSTQKCKWVDPAHKGNRACPRVGKIEYCSGILYLIFFFQALFINHNIVCFHLPFCSQGNTVQGVPFCEERDFFKDHHGRTLNPDMIHMYAWDDIIKRCV